MTIFVEARGLPVPAAPSVVLLHGIPTSTDWGAPLVAALERHRRILIPHLPGYGRSPATNPYDWDHVRGELAAALARQQATRPVMVGFSGGTWRALELVSRGLVDAAGVVCLGGLATLTTEERAGFGQFARALRDGADLRPVAGPRFLARRAGDAEAVASVQAWVPACPPRALADELDAMASRPDLLPELSPISCRVLCRTGTRDAVCPPPKAEAIVAACKDASLELVEGAGHALLVEDREETVASVARFILAR